MIYNPLFVTNHEGMSISFLRRILITLLSVGWLGPTWLGVYMYLDFWRGDGWKLLQGMQNIGSFPVIKFSQECFNVGMIWLAIAIIFWSWKFSRTEHRT